MDMMEYKFLQANLNLFNENIKKIELVLERLKQQRYILNLNDGQLLKGLNAREEVIDEPRFIYIKVIDEFRNYVFHLKYSYEMIEGTVNNLDQFIENLQRCKRPLDRKLIRKNPAEDISQQDLNELKLKYDK